MSGERILPFILMIRTLLLAFCILLVSASLPPFTITDIADGIENGADIARSFVGFLAANSIFDSNDGPRLVVDLVQDSFKAETTSSILKTKLKEVAPLMEGLLQPSKPVSLSMMAAKLARHYLTWSSSTKKS